MNTNLFIVRSPLQLLNAIEAKHHFKSAHSVLLIIHDHSKINSEQMMQIVDLTTWDNIIEFNNRKIKKQSKLLAQVKLIRSLKQHSFQSIYSGDFGTINQVIIANVDPKKVFILDDGTMTLITHGKLNPKCKVPINKKLKLLRYKVFGLKSKISSKINFFTVFSLKAHQHEEIVPNTYQYLKQYYVKEATYDTQIYVLGQPLVEAGLLEESTYIEYITHLIRHYNKPIVYVLHRGEILREELKSLQGPSFKIQMPQGPIELLFLSQKIYPLQVISFYSSALTNIEQIFERTELSAVVINSKDILKSHDQIALCYEAFKSTRISLLELR